MARTSVSTQQITRAGLVPALTAPAGTGPTNGDVIDAGPVFLMVTAGATPTTVTVYSTPTVDGLDVADLTVTVGATSTRLIGPFPARTFANAVGATDAGRVYVDYSSVATVTRGVVSF
jgi:hypothetical protein